MRKGKWLITIVLGYIYSCFFCYGKELMSFGAIEHGKRVFVESVLCGIFFSAIVFLLFFLLSKTTLANIFSIKYHHYLPNRIFLFWIMIFLAWLPVWLAGYPGYFCYDQGDIVADYSNHFFTTKHSPLLYYIEGLIISKVYGLTGSYNAGIAFYILLQMIVVSLCHAYLLSFVSKYIHSRLVMIMLVSYYALFPVISMFGVCSSKDVLFSSFASIVVILIYDLLQNTHVFFETNKLKLKLKPVLFFSMTSLMLLFRRNSIYALVITIPFIVIAVKQKKKATMFLLSSIVIINVIITNMIYPLAGVKSDSGKDMLCVPIQQIARVYSNKREILSENDLRMISSVYNDDSINGYCPVSADNAKQSFNISLLKENFHDYSKLWVDIGIKAPQEYIEAFLMMTLYAWYPDSIIDGYQQLSKGPYGWGHDYNITETSFFSCDVEEPGALDSKIPGLYKFYYHISRYISVQRIPIISLLFSIGFMLWLLLFVIGYTLHIGNNNGSVALVFPLMICVTFLFGPMVLVRYYLILFYLMAFFVMLLLTGKREGI